MSTRSSVPSERYIYVLLATAVSGFLNAYTAVTRGGTMVTMHTGNMVKLGMALAEDDVAKGANSLLLIVACMVGVLLSEIVRNVFTKNNQYGDWKKFALLLDTFLIIVVGFIPQSVPHQIVTALCAAISGLQYCIFFKWNGIGHNVAVCTGNLRTVVQTAFRAYGKGNDEAKKALLYVVLTFVFPVGSFVGTIACKLLGIYAIWCIAVAMLIISILLFYAERCQEQLS